jgi:phosphoribosyl 1,2-cyclic phosphodiesterase
MLRRKPSGVFQTMALYRCEECVVMVKGVDAQFLIHFWGVRGSYPTPGSGTLLHGGNTACVEIRVGPHTLIFDAGSGIIGLGAALMGLAKEREPLQMALFISHAHMDHLLGFPFFSPLFDERSSLHLFGPQLAGRSIEQILTPIMSPPYFPVDIRQLPSQRFFHTISGSESIVWHADKSEPQMYPYRDKGRRGERGVLRVIGNFTQQHPLNGSVVYRVEYAGYSVVYATDVEWSNGCEQEFLDFIADADVLIHDAQYTTDDYEQLKHGYGHSTVEMATEAALAAHVHELVLFHHEPTYDDRQLDIMEAEARTRFAHTRSACEGMEIDLYSLQK